MTARSRSKLDRSGLALLTALLGALLAPRGWSLQDATVPTDPPPVTVAELDELTAKLDARSDPDEDSRDRIRDLLDQAKAAVAVASGFRAQADDYEELRVGAADRLETIRAELAQPVTQPELAVPEGAALAQLEALRDQAEAELASARSTIQQIETESTERKNRRDAIPSILDNARKRLATAKDTLAKSTEPDPDDLEAVANRTLLRARVQEANSEVELLETELSSYAARAELLPSRRDEALRIQKNREGRVAAWQTLISEQRERDATATAVEAETKLLEAAEAHAVLQSELQINADLANLRVGPDGLTARLAETQRELQGRKNKLANLQAGFRSFRAKVKRAGLTRAMSSLLRTEYAELEDPSLYNRRTRLRREAISNAQFKIIELESMREKLSDIDDEVQDIIARIDEAEGPRPDDAAADEKAREILIARRALLDKLIKEDYEPYLGAMIEFRETTNRLVAGLTEYQSYLGERIFSVRSVGGSLVPSPIATADATRWLFLNDEWSEAIQKVVPDVRLQPSLAIAIAFLLSALLLGHRRTVAGLGQLGERAGRIQSASFVQTLFALALTILLSLPIPLLVWTIGTLITRPHDQTIVAVAVGHALCDVALPLFSLIFLRQMARARGLAECHLNWSRTARTALRQRLRWFTPAYVSFWVVALALDPRFAPDAEWNDSLGRIAFAGAMVALALFLKRTLGPTGPVLAEPYANRSPLMQRVWMTLYVLGFFTPLALLGLSAIGYDYTAREIHHNLLESLEVALVLIVAQGLALRWLLLARRRLALEQLRQRRETAKAEAAKAKAQAAAEEGVAVPVPAEAKPTLDEARAPGLEEINIPAMNAQTQKLVMTSTLLAFLLGMYGIWAEMVPALTVLERVELYPQIRFVEVQETGLFPVLEETNNASTSAANGSTAAATTNGGSTPDPKTASTPPTVPMMPGMPASPANGEATTTEGEEAPTVLTLGHIGLSIIFLLLTFVALRNVPGVLEFLLLQRIPLDAGSRYAVTTVVKYLILMLGISLTMGALNIGWGKIQWLAAALTFGLAFGLQEIFANFVSGLIMLFERPVRIGDIVTVGGVDGRVSRIQMRATTITDYNNLEMIVPNKEFITSKLVNWTLSDNTTRVVIPVGIAYASSPTQAKELLLEIAQNSPLVMKNPAPSVLFKNFGDSALLFDLRVYLANRDYWLALVNELREAIHTEFEKAGIEIAFPQLDLHVRSAKGLERPRETFEAES